jgi:hypothetical protein
MSFVPVVLPLWATGFPRFPLLFERVALSRVCPL